MDKFFGFCACVFFLLYSVASAEGELDRGLVAFQRGEFVVAFNEWKPLSDGGDLIAMANLGVLYMEGLGVLQDHSKAVDLLKKSAKQGLPLAQFNLALMHEKGRGMLQDRIRAHMWYNIAASKGHPESLTSRDNVARYMTGSAVEKAQKMASECLEKNYVDC